MARPNGLVQRSRIASFASRLWVKRRAVAARGEYANVLLAAKGPCVSSAFQALQIATSSVAEAVWCGSGVMVDGKTEWSGAEVADSLVWIAACGYGRRAVTAVSTPTCCMMPKDPACPVRSRRFRSRPAV